MKKSVIVLLVFSFLITPIITAFADEIPLAEPRVSAEFLSSEEIMPVEIVEPNTEPVLGESSVVDDIVLDKEKDVKEYKEDKKAKDSEDSLQVSALSMASDSSQLPKNPIESSPAKQIILEPDPSTGALVYDYPFQLPKGRNGMMPQLSLRYNSQKNDNSSLAGYGWELSIPYIIRKNTHGVDQMYARNDYTSSEDGDLVLLATNGNVLTFSPESQSSTFNKYTLDTTTNTWKLITKSGTIFIFGNSPASRQDNPGNASLVYKWMASFITDANGNFITYTYVKDSGQIYIDKITYTGNSNSVGIFEVNILRQSRIDVTKSYQSGFLFTTNYVISEVNIKVNGVTTKKYNLTYVFGDNNNRSILKTITETGSNIENTSTIVLPSTVFSNTKNSNSIFMGSDWTLPPDFRFDGSSLWGDLNGDSYPDVLTASVSANNTFIQSAYINNKDGTWTSNNSFLSPVPFVSYAFPAQSFGYRLQDLNGDGLADLFKSDKHNHYSVSESSLYINTGSGWLLSQNQIPTTLSFGGVSIGMVNDLNGDGLPDMYTSSYGLSTPRSVYLNNGNFTWTDVTSSWLLDGTFSSISSPYIFYLDINGDEITDIAKITFSLGQWPITSASVYLGTGTGEYIKAPEYETTIAFSFYTGTNPTDLGIRFIDLNGDGLPELIRSSSKANTSGNLENPIYLNTGHGFTLVSNWSVPYMSDNFSARVQTIDINADGLTDIYDNNGYVSLNNSTRADSLSSVIIPGGGKIEVTYKLSNQYKDVSNSLLNPKIPFGIQTVNTIITTDLVNSISSVDTYQYVDGFYYFNTTNPFARKFAGFGAITKTNAIGNITKTYFHQGNASDSNRGEYQDSYFKIGKPYRMEILDSHNNVYQKTVNTWDEFNLGAGAKFVTLQQVVNYAYDGNATHRDIAQSYVYDNANGNILQNVSYGEVLGNDNGTFADIGTDKLVTNSVYTAGVIALPSQISIVDQQGVKLQESKFYYDNLAQGSVTKGNVTKKEDLKSANTYVNAQNVYDGVYGLITQSKDQNGNTTTYSYDSVNLYPAVITNVLRQTNKYAYDYAFGKITQKTDQNNRVFQYRYDGLGRLIEEKQPDTVNPAGLVIKATYSYVDTPNAISVKKSNYFDGVNVVDAYHYFDSLSRKIQERQEVENGNFIVKDYVYDNLSQLQKESLPYFSNGSNKTSITGDSALYTYYSYDALSRINSTTNSLGVTTNIYDDWKVVTRDANNKNKDFYKDAYGNLIQVNEYNQGISYATFYAYDGLSRLLKITDAAGNVRNFTYDNLGNKLTAEDLHSPSDTTFGKYIYVYNNVGNVITKVNPNNQTINYNYDALNRMVGESSLVGGVVSYMYDQGIDGIGRLTSVKNKSVAQTNEYNALGLIKSEKKLIGQNTYVTSYEYDRQGNQILVINPDNSQIKNSYNTAGLLESIQRKESTDANFVSVVNNFDYSPLGQVAAQYNANGVSSVTVYDALKMYQLKSKVTATSNGSRVQDLNYAYDTVGNITQIIDSSIADTKKTSNYSYDDLYRLTSAKITSSASGQQDYTQNFSYDSIGNIVTKTEALGVNAPSVYAYTYAGNTGTNYANPHAVTSISSGSLVTNYAYDKSGNILGDGAKTYVFDHNNRLSSVTIAVPTGAAPTSTTATFYSSTGDGSVQNYWQTWLLAQATTTGRFANSTNTTFKVNSGKYGTPYFNIERGFVVFDTSSLPDNAVIGSVKLKLFIDSKLNDKNDGNDFMSLVQGTQLSTESLSLADFGKAGAVLNAVEGVDVSERKDITDIAVNQYSTFNLNATGKSWVSKTGFSKFALRQGHDLLNVQFNADRANQYDQLVIRSSEYAGTSFDPVLEITYTLPVTQPTPVVINYDYDAQGQRVKVSNVNSGKTTYYPSALYNTDGATVTKHIFAGAQDIATIQGSGLPAKVYHNSSDSLNSSAVMTDSIGVVIETLDYYPFGGIRFDKKATGSTFDEQRKYIGQEFDVDTGLNYLNARYYNAAIGRFISQDPMFWALPNELLADPQQLNSYSYARNNPIVMSDPSGLISDQVAGIQAEQVYIDGHEGDGLSGAVEQGWAVSNIIHGLTGMKMVEYTRYDSDQSIIEKSIAFRGTRSFNDNKIGFLSDWLNNIAQPLGLSSDAWEAIYNTSKVVNANPGIKVTAVGHSKGGAEAGNAAQWNSIDAVVFNSAPIAFWNPDCGSKCTVKSFTVRGEILNNSYNSSANPSVKNMSLPYTDFSKNYGSNWNPLNAVRNGFSDIKSSLKNHGIGAVNNVIK